MNSHPNIINVIHPKKKIYCQRAGEKITSRHNKVYFEFPNVKHDICHE
jgi:hypothetical protein